MKYEYLLLLRQTALILAFQMPHLQLFFVAHASHFDFDARRAGDGLHIVVAGLLNRETTGVE